VVVAQVKIQVEVVEQEELFLHHRFKSAEQLLIVRLLVEVEQKVFLEVQQHKAAVVQIHQFLV
jgi:hypothetical protein